MASLLEQTRVEHEEVERLERLVVDRLSQEARSFRERLVQSQTVSYMVDQITHRAAKLVRAPGPHCRAVCPPLRRVVPQRP
jgi:splicing factor 3A subunit 3